MEFWENLKEQWSQTPLWQKLILTSIFPIVIAGALYFYLIVPSINEKEKLIQEKLNINDEITKLLLLKDPSYLRKFEDKVKELERQKEEKIAQLEKEAGKVVSKENISKVIEDIKSLADAHFVNISSVSITEPYHMLANWSTGGKLNLIPIESEHKTKSPRSRKKQTQPSGKKITFVDMRISFRGTEESVNAFLKDLKGIVAIPKQLNLQKKAGGSVNGEIVLQAVVF